MKAAIAPLTHHFNTQLTLPGSKSISNRALLLAALARGTSTLHNMLDSADTNVFYTALQALGVSLTWERTQRQCQVHGVAGQFPNKQATVWCQDAGTAARFLTAACAINQGSFVIDGSARLRQRPIAPLLSALVQQKMLAPFDKHPHLPLTLQPSGEFIGGNIYIDSDQSSQFFSALMMIAPFAKQTVTLQTEQLISQPYVTMTAHMMQAFGVTTNRQCENHFTIAAPQAYQACDYVIEPDLSTASYFFAAAALTQSTITIANIQREQCIQGDIAFLEVLEKMGCVVQQTPQGVRVQGPKQLHGITVDMRDFSDTFMTLAAIAPFASAPVTITNIAHTRLQESDRLSAVQENLTRCQIPTKVGHDWITIYPHTPLAATLPSYNDHRIAMAFALMGLRTPGITILDAQCVDKTCPNYFELLAQLSG